MRRIFILLIAVQAWGLVVCQSPEAMSFQAVIRDANSALVQNTQVGIQISVIQGNATGLPVYVERHTPTTNDNGLATIEIGNGSIITGSFSNIDWTNGPYFLRTDTDLNGGANYTISGTSQLLSVPYALYAENSGNVTGHLNEIDGDTTNELQTISRNGLTVTLSNGGGSFVDSIQTFQAGQGIEIMNDTISVTSNGLFPAGMIVPFAGSANNIPSGWFLCDGSAISRTTYGNLFSVVGISWGTGDGITTFNLPDFRGRFLRGQDLGSGNDPDVSGRFAVYGGNTGNNVGSYQGDQLESHTHTYSQPYPANDVDRGGSPSLWSVDNQLTSNTSSTGGSETRPKNAAVNYLIKY